MSNFTYEKYIEIVDAISYLSDKLRNQNKDDYKSLKVEEIAYQLISVSNSLNAYIRHSKRENIK